MNNTAADTRIRSGVRARLLATFLTLGLLASLAGFLLNYNTAKAQILSTGGEQLRNMVRDAIGFASVPEARVEAGNLTREEAQDIFRDALLDLKTAMICGIAISHPWHCRTKAMTI